MGKRLFRRVSAGVVAAVCLAGCAAELDRRAAFVGEVQSVSRERLGRSWHEGCPVAPSDLRLVRVSFWGFDDRGHVGELVVHRTIAPTVVDAFRELWNGKFPIARMETVERYITDSQVGSGGEYVPPPPGPDLLNDTYGFLCRRIAGSNSWSAHAFGLAIDINPVENPYLKGATVIPTNGSPDRVAGPGKMLGGDWPVQAFVSRGMVWGGNWRTLKDYMHFTANGH